MSGSSRKRHLGHIKTLLISTYLAIDGVSLEGNTGVGELSATYRKSADSPWAASVVLKGYVGQRQGAAGQVRLDYRF